MGYVLVLLGASMTVGPPPAPPAPPVVVKTAVRAHRTRFWRKIAGAEPALALRLSSWGIDHSKP